MRERLVGAALYVAAALANLPIVYRLVGDGAVQATTCLMFGSLAMGLAWAGGFLLEGRKRWFSLFMAAVGGVELVFALTPIGADLGAGLTPYLVTGGALSLAALGFALARVRGPRAA